MSNTPAALDTQSTRTLLSGLRYVQQALPAVPHPTFLDLLAPILITTPQMSRDRPVERCPECGNVLKMEYVGPQEDAHDHHHEHHGDGHHNHEEPKTFADFVRPEYR